MKSVPAYETTMTFLEFACAFTMVLMPPATFVFALVAWEEVKSRKYWRPIRTAPRDGTLVLLYEKKLGIMSGNYRIRPWFPEGAWLEERDDEGNYHLEPTHWMPMPELPNL